MYADLIPSNSNHAVKQYYKLINLWSELLLLTIAVAVKCVLHSAAARNLCAIKQVHYPQHAVLEKWLHSRLELIIQYLLNVVLCTGD